jgi:hypothetical protein
MNSADYNDPAIEEQWCNARRADVVDYLKREGCVHGEVGEWPAWHLAPYVSIWAVESLRNPGWVGWWAICGDGPTDYISAGAIRHPREAMRAFGQSWAEQSSYMARGEPHPTTSMGSPEDWPMLGPLLRSRADMLCKCADDDALWEE